MSADEIEVIAKENVEAPTGSMSKLVSSALKVLCVFSLLMVATAGLVTPSATAQSVSDETAFINGINEVRTNLGLAPLSRNTQMTTLARSWTSAMSNGVCADGAYICHASPLDEGVTVSWAKLGENVGTGPNVDDVMAAFIASPGHYANIIDPAFTHIGVGVAWDGARLYTTHRFLDLNSSTPTTTTAPTTTTTAAPTTTRAPATTSAPATTAAPATTTRAPTVPATTASTAAPAATPSTTAASAPVTDSDSAFPEEGITEIVTETGQVNIGQERAAVLVNALATLSE